MNNSGAEKQREQEANRSGELGQQAWTQLEKLRQEAPLVQCITNFVSMDIMANVLLSAGASPAMIHSIEEIPEFTPKAHALCVNMGTLTPNWLPAMKKAAEVANKEGKPWVLDPVAAGATSFRLKACIELLELKPTVVRGNASEILALFKSSLDSNSKVREQVTLITATFYGVFFLFFSFLLNTFYSITRSIEYF